MTMDADEGDNVRRTSSFDAAIRVAAGHDGKDGEQQHVGQLVELALRPARIKDVRQHVNNGENTATATSIPVAASRVR